MINVDKDGWGICDWSGCKKRFKPNLLKGQECCSAKCRGARWRARTSQTAAITEIKRRLDVLELYVREREGK